MFGHVGNIADEFNFIANRLHIVANALQAVVHHLTGICGLPFLGHIVSNMVQNNCGEHASPQIKRELAKFCNGWLNNKTKETYRIRQHFSRPGR